MGNLKPGATYVYESPDNGKTIYAREMGSTDKQLVGYSYDNTKLSDDQLWQDIRAAAKDNPALKNALEQCKILYHLSKKEKPLFWHPV